MGVSKYDITSVLAFLNEYDINNECTLLSTEYKNSKDKLLFLCNICGKNFERNFGKLKQKRFCCPTCGMQRGARALEYTQEKVQEKIESKGYTLIGEFTGGHNPCKCKCSRGHEFDLYFSEFLNRGRGCRECAIIDHSGINHWNYQGGGHQDTMDAFRHTIIPWKKEILKKANYVCDIDKNHTDNLVIHHMEKNFVDIVKEASINTEIPILNDISEYTPEDRFAIEKEILDLHYKYEAVVIQRKYHDAFHLKYGKTKNTKEQYLEFKEEILKLSLN